MRIALIDCGTNTFNLLIVELNNDKSFETIFSTSVSVKLGDTTINKGYISADSFQRGIKTLNDFRENINKFQVQKTLAYATSAIRDAKNKEDFINKVYLSTQIQLDVIDGDRESDLIYKGVKAALSLKKSNSLIMDIGGGSIEFILANIHGVLWKQSFSIGVARLNQKFIHSDPIKLNEIKLIYNYLNQELLPLFEAVKKFPPIELIGSSGVFESIIELIHFEFNGDKLVDSKNEYYINFDLFINIFKIILNSSLDQRAKLKGLINMRIDTIVISCLMIDFILNSFSLKCIRMTTFSLKEGALFELMEKNSN